MSVPANAPATPVESKRQLVEYLERGPKPRERWRIGTEHEKFGFNRDSLRPLPYDGPAGVHALLDGLTQFGWVPLMEGPNPIALTRDGAAISLEPGGQFELSGAPLETLHQTRAELDQHFAEVGEVGAELNAGFLGLGFNPKWSRDETPVMPKGRYGIMRRYMPKKGAHGLDMMFRTCTVQVNLDFASEADMVNKFRVALALQPIATALFANSPFVEGRDTGLLSNRAFAWTDTDPDRCGLIPFVFEGGMGFERYVDYALDVPMYFVYRDGRYIDAAGQSFRDFIAGRLPAFPGELPTLKDWADHLTTLFPEARLKHFLEMRGADAGSLPRLAALPALWVGLLYDDAAQAAAWALVKDWKPEEREQLRRDVPRLALRARLRNRTAQEIARDVLAIARAGLKARRRLNEAGLDESVHLDTLDAVVATGRTAAEDIRDRFHGPWGENIDRAFHEAVY
ncbi:MAG: glutamate--cysteine ligase [Alphaproteobacteria bacterium]|nr:glutamate--cysteine ligase [Alphaproteobacteria bacterium]